MKRWLDIHSILIKVIVLLIYFIRPTYIYIVFLGYEYVHFNDSPPLLLIQERTVIKLSNCRGRSPSESDMRCARAPMGAACGRARRTSDGGEDDYVFWSFPSAAPSPGMTSSSHLRTPLLISGGGQSQMKLSALESNG